VGDRDAVISRLLGMARRRWDAAQIERQRARLARLEVRSGLGDSAWLLHGLVRSLKPRCVVEIGSAAGASTCFIAQALRENDEGRLWAIDPHVRTEWNDRGAEDSHAQLVANLRALDLSSRVEIVRAFSHEAAARWRDPIDLLFIDGDHSFEGVERDWRLFSPFVREFGFVVFHDTLWDRRPDARWAREGMGVPRFVEALREQGFPIVTVDRNFGVSLVQPVRGGIRLSGAAAPSLSAPTRKG
jgi:predicted O-methyltransferase YrrM